MHRAKKQRNNRLVALESPKRSVVPRGGGVAGQLVATSSTGESSPPKRGQLSLAFDASGVVPGGVITEKVGATSSNAARVVSTSPEPVGGVEGIRKLLKARRGW